MCCSINVYVDGCCVQRLSVGNGEGSIGELKEELSRSLDPLVLQAKLEEEEGCVAPPLDTVDQAETDGAPATFLALLCSFGMLARGVATHVETSACMEGEPAGWLAEAGRSLGQPGRAPALNAAFRSAVQGGLLSTLGRHASALKSENEMLRRCLQDSRTPGAFESYLRASTTY